MIMISLIGEQPIPNLLPVLHHRPDIAVLVYSHFTERAAGRLRKLLPAPCEHVAWCVEDAYDINQVRGWLLDQIAGQGWGPGQLVFNITGGTKSMALAAYLAAAALHAPFLYLQSEGKQSRLYGYEFDAQGLPCSPQSEFLPPLMNLDLYLRAYVDSYQVTGFANEQDGGLFERAIYGALVDYVDEIIPGVKLLGAVDVDFALRCGNQVGVIEAKTGSGLKKGIDQLNGAAGQRYLGSYIRKILVTDTVWDQTRSNLRELAESRNVEIIELPSYGLTKRLSEGDVRRLRERVCACVGEPCRATAPLVSSGSGAGGAL